MQDSNSKLQIHTVIAPGSVKDVDTPRRVRLKWGFQIKPKAKKPTEKQPKPVEQPKQRKTTVGVQSAQKKLKSQLTATEKLLRNSAVACALLLTVMALQNMDQPWTRNTTDKIKQAITMRIDLDESLGRLNFVRGLVPDTALVFWNMGEGGRLQLPVNGTISHEYTDMQPWVEFVCNPQQPVVAVEKGTVSAVGQSAQGDWTLLIDHEGGEQSLYAYLSQALVKVGQTVDRGAQVGITEDQDASRLYFELRKDGVPQNPGSRMS